jgi:hypothetical protein
MKAAALLLCAVLLSACLSAKERAERLAADDAMQVLWIGLWNACLCRLPVAPARRTPARRSRGERCDRVLAYDNQLRVANAVAV